MQADEDPPVAQPAALPAGGGVVTGSQDVVLAGQQLEHIPAGAWHEALASLDASGNRLAEWPLPSTGLPALRRIYLSRNPGIASVPADAFACCAASLEHLDVSGRLPLPKQLAALCIACSPAIEGIHAGWALLWSKATALPV